MKQKCQSPEGLGDVTQLSDAELKIKQEQSEYRLSKTYQASENYIHRKIADSDVLISVGSNIANFNGYIQMNESAVILWEKLQMPCKLNELEQELEVKYGISHEKAVEDVQDFLKELLEHDMVMIS